MTFFILSFFSMWVLSALTILGAIVLDEIFILNIDWVVDVGLAIFSLTSFVLVIFCLIKVWELAL